MLRSQLELAQVKQEIDKKVSEKEDEFNNTRCEMTKIIKACKTKPKIYAD